MKEKRSLYECFNARGKDSRIRCSKGYSLMVKTEDGGVDIGRLANGRPLAYGVCQNCPDFDFMGPPIPREERGWLNKKGNK